MTDAIRSLTISVDLEDNVTEELQALWDLVTQLVETPQEIEFTAFGLDDIVDSLSTIQEATEDSVTSVEDLADAAGQAGRAMNDAAQQGADGFKQMNEEAGGLTQQMTDLQSVFSVLASGVMLNSLKRNIGTTLTREAIMGTGLDQYLEGQDTSKLKGFVEGIKTGEQTEIIDAIGIMLSKGWQNQDAMISASKSLQTLQTSETELLLNMSGLSTDSPTSLIYQMQMAMNVGPFEELKGIRKERFRGLYSAFGEELFKPLEEGERAEDRIARLLEKKAESSKQVEYLQAMDTFSESIAQSWQTIATSVLPVAADFIKVIADMLELANQIPGLIPLAAVLIGIAAGMAAIGGAMSMAAPFLSFLGIGGGAAAAGGAAAGGGGLLAALGLTGPVGWIMLAIAGIVLLLYHFGVLQDAWKTFAGSHIGRDVINELDKMVDSAKELYQWLHDKIGGVFDYIGEKYAYYNKVYDKFDEDNPDTNIMDFIFGDIWKMLGNLSEALTGVNWVELFGGIEKAFTDFYNWFNDWLIKLGIRGTSEDATGGLLTPSGGGDNSAEIADIRQNAKDEGRPLTEEERKKIATLMGFNPDGLYVSGAKSVHGVGLIDMKQSELEKYHLAGKTTSAWEDMQIAKGAAPYTLPTTESETEISNAPTSSLGGEKPLPAGSSVVVNGETVTVVGANPANTFVDEKGNPLPNPASTEIYPYVNPPPPTDLPSIGKEGEGGEGKDSWLTRKLGDLGAGFKQGIEVTLPGVLPAIDMVIGTEGLNNNQVPRLRRGDLEVEAVIAGMYRNEPSGGNTSGDNNFHVSINVDTTKGADSKKISKDVQEDFYKFLTSFKVQQVLKKAAASKTTRDGRHSTG